MNNNQKTTYLLTFNVNIYAETTGNQPESMYDYEGKSVIQYRKGDTLEISEEAFIRFIEFGGMVNLDETPITGEPCRAHFTTEDIDNVAEKVTTINIRQYVSTVDYANGITAWAESQSAARMVDKFNGDNFRYHQWRKREDEKEENQDIPCSLEQDIEWAMESENLV